MSDDKRPYLTAEDVREIMRLLEGSAFNVLELEMGDLRLRLQRNGAAASPIASKEAAVPSASFVQRPAANGAHPPPVRPEPAAAPQAQPGPVEIRASTPGRFYRAPRPGEPPFVEVGAAVAPDTTVGIIEVMKLMNGVLAGVAGEIREICAEDGQPVEYNQVLMRVARLGA
jgi:acetyl-CoA carboxylase biotin carboxyl carrier protein